MKKNFLIIATFVIILVMILAGLTFLSGTSASTKNSTSQTSDVNSYSVIGQCTKIVTTDGIVVTKKQTGETEFE